MNLKKLSALGLSAMIGLGSVVPAYANEVTNSYFEDYKKVSDWKQLKSQSMSSLGVDFSGQEKINANVDLDVSSSYDKDTQMGDIKIKVNYKVSMPEFNKAIPDIHVIINKDTFYVNKEAMNKLSEIMSLGKTFEKDYVKIVLSDEDKKKLGLTPDVIKSASNSETTEKILNFLKKIDIGVDLGITKKENTYTLSMDADKLVDLVNGYVKYLFKNPDLLLDFYKDALGVDILEMSGTTKEDFKKSLAESEAMWKKQVEPMLPKVKEILKGTTIMTTEKFDEGKYASDMNMSLMIDISKAKELFTGQKDSVSEKFMATLKSNGVVEKVADIGLKMPTKVEEFNVSEYMKQKEEELKKLSAIEVKVTPSKKLMTITQYGETDKIEKADVKVVKGVLYVSTQLMIDEFYLDLDVEKDGKYVPFKKTMESNGYKVTYDSKTKTVMATNL